MKLFLVITIICVLLLSTVDAHYGPRPRTFRLRADRRAPAPISNFSYLDHRLGFFDAPEQPYRGYIEPYGNRTDPSQKGWGKLHDATAPANILWLRPTHGTPMYYVFNGDPQGDTIPALTLWDSWAVVRGTDGRQWLGYGLGTGSWMACYGRETGNWRLYLWWAVHDYFCIGGCVGLTLSGDEKLLQGGGSEETVLVNAGKPAVGKQ